MLAKIKFQNVDERDNLEELSPGWRIVLKRILEK
jgi:hypothetical protein